MAMKLEEEWARRVVAALEIADIRGPNEKDGPDRLAGLAERIDFGTEGNLRKLLHRPTSEWRKGRRELFLQQVAEACGLPYEFFVIDFATLGQVKRPAEERDPHADGARR